MLSERPTTERGHRRSGTAQDRESTYPSETFVTVWEALARSLKTGGRPVSVVGPPGVGKTTLLNALMQSMNAECRFGFIWNTSLLKLAFVETLANCFDIDLERVLANRSDTDQGRRDDTALDREVDAFLETATSAGLPVALVVDEAQSLSSDELDRLMRIAYGKPLRTVVLAGQPMLESNLELCELGESIPTLHLEQLSEAETAGYIQYLKQTAGSGQPFFDDDAISAIFHATQGTPREINQLCERCLVLAKLHSATSISAETVAQARQNYTFADHLATFAPMDEVATMPLLLESKHSVEADPERRRQTSPVASSGPMPDPIETLPTGKTATLSAAASTPPPPKSEQDANSDSAAPHHQRRSGRRWLIGTAVAAGLAAVGYVAQDRFAMAPTLLSPVDAQSNREPQLPPLAPALDQSAAASLPDSPKIAIQRDRIDAALEGLPSDPDATFRLGVSVADSDPLLAAAAFSLAALSGNDRAAYYLGQMFEAGDGIPRDTALAAAWYRRAAESQPFARDSLAELARPDRGAVTAPVPLSVHPEDGDAVALAWISGTGPDPHEYRVEFADNGSAAPLASEAATLSALRTDLPPNAERWRILSMDSTGARVATSGWQPLHPPH